MSSTASLLVMLPYEVRKHFPNIKEGDKSSRKSQYFQKELRQAWWVDTNFPDIGVISDQEASILSHLASQFSGENALEIGSFVCYSTAFLALSGLKVDTVDPLLKNPMVLMSAVQSLRSTGCHKNVTFHPGCSPEAVTSITDPKSTTCANSSDAPTSSQHRTRTWSFFFVDGDHTGDAPLRDVKLCCAHAHPDRAMIVLHDVLFPEVTKSLLYLQDQGWNVVIFKTQQLLAAAWRGDDIRLPEESLFSAHAADEWSIPEHIPVELLWPPLHDVESSEDKLATSGDSNPTESRVHRN